MAGTEVTLLSILVAVALCSLSDAQSNYVYETYEYTCPVGVCKATLQRRRCLDGWIGCKCDMPVCNPACKGDQVCGRDHKCVCLKTGTSSSTNCPFAKCPNGDDCYPGTCSDNGVNCTCPLQYGFSGKNCLQITATPTIRDCTILVFKSIQSVESQIASASCAVDTNSPPVTYINSSAVSKIEAIWTADRGANFPDLPGPTVVNYLVTVPVQIGVTKAGVDTSLIDVGINITQICARAREGPTPETSVPCDEKQAWTDIGSGQQPQHNQSFRVTVWAQLGGQKQVSGGQTQVLQFIGTRASRSAVFKVDLFAPVHCLTNNSKSPEQCPYFPIYLDQDIRTDPSIQPKFYNWTDDGSGVQQFEIAIYPLTVNPQNNLLDNIGGPIPGSKQLVSASSANNYIHTLTKEGIYSMEVTVSDAAGNFARARKIFIYNPSSSLTPNPNAPIHLVQANSQMNVSWLTTFDDSRDGSNIPLTVTWKDHFQSSAQFRDLWGLAVNPWPTADNLIDDKFEGRYGRRTIWAISSLTGGISSYAVSYIVDPSLGGRGLSPRNWITLNSTITSYNLPINQTLTDGTTIVVWVQATDASFGTLVEKMTVGVDRSPPVVTAQYKELKTGVFQSSTSIRFTVADPESGISKISYRIFVSENPLGLKEIGPTTRVPPPPGSRQKREAVITACTSTDKTCYCIPQGICYNYNQTIDIDNCDIDRLAGQSFVVRYTVTNLANLTSIEQSFDLGFLQPGEIPCRKQPTCSGGCIAGIVIGVIFGLLILLLLILILILLIRTYYFKKPVPRRIDNMGKTFRRVVGRSYEDENAAYESSGAFSNISKRVSVVFSGKGKKAAADDDDYIYTGSEAVRNNSTHIQRKNLQMDNLISNEGRFAVIKKAYLQDGNERKTVAVKALRSGFSAADVKLMEEKILFLSGVPRHANIVNFLGASEEENNGGPMMILEYCGIPLKDWLKQQQKVTSEVLESMLTFTLNIARGVEHLHDNEIIHRRLAVRNVLLTQQFGGWVAKLIGFGPNRDDSSDGTKKAAVPVKWLSPETLASLNNIDPTYNKKTDVWSFGITVWEIYSLGEAPYPGKNSNEAKKLVIKGLKPTKPNECPEDLYQTAIQPCWETNPNNRPDMSRICSAIDNFKKGGSDGQGYYTQGDDDYGGQAYGGQAYGGARHREPDLYDDGQ